MQSRHRHQVGQTGGDVRFFDDIGKVIFLPQEHGFEQSALVAWKLSLQCFYYADTKAGLQRFIKGQRQGSQFFYRTVFRKRAGSDDSPDLQVTPIIESAGVFKIAWVFQTDLAEAY